MTRAIFNTATTLNGFLADDADSLSWLFAVPGADAAENDFGGFLKGIGAVVMGSTTYEWIVRHEGLLDHPEKWFYSDKAAFVLSSRALPKVAGADIRLRTGDVGELWPEILGAAGDRDVWLVGGGHLAAQFAAEGLIDELILTLVPVVLGSGLPTFAGRLAEPLTLTGTRPYANGMVELRYRFPS